MACERITKGITAAFAGKRPIKALLDPYNPVGSTNHVRFNTSKTLRWETKSERCHINWVILDSDWEAEFCDVYEIESDFAKKVEAQFSKMISSASQMKQNCNFTP